MDSEIASRLATLPSLDHTNRAREALSCKICQARAEFFDVVDFNKVCSQVDCYQFGSANVNVRYFRCERCGFLFTDFFDDWSQEDFSKFIYNRDYAKVDGDYLEVRPAALAIDIAQRLREFESARILDFGSGNGLFAERLKAMGFHSVESYDPFSNPTRPTGLFDIITCFEVIEHTLFPIETLRDMSSMLTEDGCIIFSQTLQPDDILSQRGSWWYLAPRNGHVSTFTRSSLASAANSAGLIFHGVTSPFAFSQPVTSELSEKVLSGIGASESFFILDAPISDLHIRPDQWHELEGSPRGSFRWTKGPRVFWPLSPAIKYPAVIRFVIPFLDQIRPGFIEESRLSVGDNEVPLVVDGSVLTAEIKLSRRGAQQVVLSTPDPITPWQLRQSPDHRPLGLAISTGRAGRA